MTKKHFIELADLIRSNQGVFTDAHISILAGFCADQNPRFNYQRWIGYIQGENGSNGGKV